MKKFFGFIGKIFKNKIGRIIMLMIFLSIVSFMTFVYLYNKNEKVDVSYIITTLEKSSELTTAKLNYSGMLKFEDDGIPLINKSNFTMVYDAIVRTGIDAKEIKVEADGFSDTIWLTIPKARVLDVKIDSNTVKYFDEKFALFNVNSKEDVNKAMSLAEEDAKEKMENMGVLEMADLQAEALIKGLIQDVIPNGYQIKVR